MDELAHLTTEIAQAFIAGNQQRVMELVELREAHDDSIDSDTVEVWQ